MSQSNKYTKTGSAGAGSHHWMHQRITAVANLFLMPWFLINAIHILKSVRYNFADFLASAVNSILLICLIISVFYHGTLGIQVVIEDYIHNNKVKWPLLIGLKLLAFLACVSSILAISVSFYYLNFHN